MPQGTDAIKLTAKRTYTKEGYLIAPAVLAKSGVLPYYAKELELTDRAPNTIVQVFRSTTELAKSVPTFESKPITLDHPPEGVDATTWRELAVGDVHDVSAAGDSMHGTVIIRDKAAIDEVKHGRRQLSNGYTFELRPVSGQKYEFEQVDIQGNHIAIVDRARCGPSCIVGDRDPIIMESEDKKLMKVTLDGYPCEVDETAAVVFKKQGDAIATLEAKLKEPPKVKIGDKLCDEAEVIAMLNQLQVDNKKLKDDALTPEKFKQQYAAEQKIIANVRDMLPQMEIAENADAVSVCREALPLLEAGSPTAKAQIAAALDGTTVDKAKPEDLYRAIRTLHASIKADNTSQKKLTTQLGKAIMQGGDKQQLDGRDAWVHRITHILDEKPNSTQEEL